MNDYGQLSARLDELERKLAERDRRIAELEAENGALRARNAELEAKVIELTSRIEELEAELRRRGKNYRPKPNSANRRTKGPDRRRTPHRKHPGIARPKIEEAENAVHHDVTVAYCPYCGGDIEPTDEFDDVYVEDIPDPKPEIHRYRRHICRCKHCKREVKGRSDLDVPGGTVGDRAKLVTVYSRAHLGISLGKTTDLLDNLFGIKLSRAGALGHLRRFAENFDPVVQQLIELLKNSPVVHADETGWRINGKNVWCWMFANPKIAVYLIDHHRSRAVFESALGASLPGVLITDFYAAYNKIDCKKQRCLTHLLRDLAELREELEPRLVAKNIQPLIDFFQDAIGLSHKRSELSPEEFARQADDIKARFRELWWRRSSNAECQRIYHRLRRHKEELLTFLDHPEVAPHNNAAERDIRSVAAARSDGGVNRTDWGAKAFAVAKTIIRTCQKSGINFFHYALGAMNNIRARAPTSPPIPATN